MSKKTVELFDEPIESFILFLRGQRVMLDTDLAKLYGVETRRLNEQVKRNIKRFPDDFMFRLSQSEKKQLVANCDRFKNLKHSVSLPYAFTEHGAVMLASVLKSDMAVQVSVNVVRAFVRIREMLLTNNELSLRLDALEARYDEQFKIVFNAIRELMPSSKNKNKPIGFRFNEEKQDTKSREKDNENI
jgi:hypothetical protein